MNYATDYGELSNLYATKCADFDILQAENQGLKANGMILNTIIENNSNPLNKDKIVSLIMENSKLQSELARYKQAEDEGRLIIKPDCSKCVDYETCLDDNCLGSIDVKKYSDLFEQDKNSKPQL